MKRNYYDPVELRVERGRLMHPPPSDHPRGEIRLSWIATVLDRPNGQWPDTKQFWRNQTLPVGLCRGDVVQFSGSESVIYGPEDDETVERWRWTGVVLSVPPHPDRTGVLQLRRFGALRTAFKAAVSLTGPSLEGVGLEAFLRTLQDEDIGALPLLCDWLEERGDSRGEAFKQEVLRLAAAFFPEVKE